MFHMCSRYYKEFTLPRCCIQALSHCNFSLRAENYFLPFLLYVRKVKRTTEERAVVILHKKTENKESGEHNF